MKYRTTVKLKTDLGEKFPEYLEAESWREPRLRTGFGKKFRFRNTDGDLVSIDAQQIVYVFSKAVPVEEAS